MGNRTNLRLAYLGASVRQAHAAAIQVTPRLASAIRTAQTPAAPLQTSAPAPSPVAQASAALTPAAAALAPAAPPVTATSIIAQVCPAGITAQPCGCTVDSASMQTLFTNSVNARLLMWPPPDANFAGNCSASGANALQKTGAIVGAGGGIAATILAASPAAGPAAPIVAAAAGITALISSIFGGAHAKAVAAQDSALCTAVPSANAALQQIDSGLAAGTITPSTAAGYYSQIGAQFTAAMKAGTSYKQCDALFAYNLAMQMVLAARTADLAALSSGSAGAVTGAVDTLATDVGLPPIALWGAAAVLAYFLLT